MDVRVSHVIRTKGLKGLEGLLERHTGSSLTNPILVEVDLSKSMGCELGLSHLGQVAGKLSQIRSTGHNKG